jgi:hypothetical protein
MPINLIEAGMAWTCLVQVRNSVEKKSPYEADIFSIIESDSSKFE